MKVLLVKDVHKLGRAGDVKRVADGFGRNYLIPQGLAVLATKGALKQVEHIRTTAATSRSILNEELKDIAEKINGLKLEFSAKAGETGKMYGSITSKDIAGAILEKTQYEIKRQQIDMQPIRVLGEYPVFIRLTMDLIPELTVIVRREGEAFENEQTPTSKAESTGTSKSEKTSMEDESLVAVEAQHAENVDAGDVEETNIPDINES
jgi:large subunit ribosomal protein L9